MACTYLGELHETEGEITSKPSEKATRTFRVQSDSSSDTYITACAAVGIPDIGESYPGNSRLTVQNKTARRQSDESYQLWLVTCEYSTISGELNPLGTDDNPLLRPVIEQWGFETYQEVASDGYLKDIDTGEFGTSRVPVTNSAGDLMTDAPMKTIYMPRLTFTRNESSFNYSVAAPYVGKINSAAWYGADIAVVLCTNISAVRRAPENGYPTFWEVTYEFLFRAEKWYNSFQDVGYYVLLQDNTGSMYRSPYLDIDGAPRTSPGPLNGHGQYAPYAFDDDPLNDVYLRTYLFYDSVDFSALGLTG